MIDRFLLETIIKEEIEKALLEEGFKDKLTKGLAGLALAGGLGLATPNVAAASPASPDAAVASVKKGPMYPSLGYSTIEEQEQVMNMLLDKVVSAIKADKKKHAIYKKIPDEEGSKLLMAIVDQGYERLRKKGMFVSEEEIQQAAEEVVKLRNELRPGSIANMRR